MNLQSQWEADPRARPGQVVGKLTEDGAGARRRQAGTIRRRVAGENMATPANPPKREINRAVRRACRPARKRPLSRPRKPNRPLSLRTIRFAPVAGLDQQRRQTVWLAPGSLLGRHERQTKHSFSNVEQHLIDWVLRLVRSDSKWLGTYPVEGAAVRLAPQAHPNRKQSSSGDRRPYWPYAIRPRQQTATCCCGCHTEVESCLIDDLTGGFGYSHLTVDTGEGDLPTGSP